MKLELGSGERPTQGYLHQDIIQLSVPLDFCCMPWEIPLEENSLDEVIAIAVMEHLRYAEVHKTLEYIYKLLKPEGFFLFDVPDLEVWNEYLYKNLLGEDTPYSYEDIIKTMWGWQRWPGDEHKSMWTALDISKACINASFKLRDGFDDIKERVQRDRFKPEYVEINAHIFVKAIK